jgi:hypothetical protein
LILLRGTESTLSSANDANDPAQGGAALSADGNVIAFGDFTFLSSPYENYTDNASLIGNLADFALSGKQKIALNNFPFLFNSKTVQVYLSSDLTKTAEMVAALGRLQTSLQYMNVTVEFVDELPKDGDAIILGMFAPNEEMDAYINKFDLTFEEGSEFITVPGFGDIGIYGNNILLLDASNKGNKIVLLANSMEDMIYLVDTMSSGSLSGCLLQETSAVCSTGFGSSYEGDTTSTDTTDTTSGEATPEPEATATPQG